CPVCNRRKPLHGACGRIACRKSSHATAFEPAPTVFYPLRLHSTGILPIWRAGGWWWTSHSPTGSGPEGSSPNEPRHGSSCQPPTLLTAPTTVDGQPLWLTPLMRPVQTGGCERSEWRTEGQLMDTKSADGAYRVLARKYRPQNFNDLIGQEPMVRTLKNAFETGRIAQAWMLTGVRGVGKTTTARILARALNYKTDTVDQPTIDLSVQGENCQAIMEGRHVDVIEMDAASHTGIDDIREIIEQVRYRPVSARYKVYIIDEVHMLSTAAFNGLLKTLEEPPPHVKF